MTELLSLHDADKIAEESAPVQKPGLFHVFAGMLRQPRSTLTEAFTHPIQLYAVLLASAGGVYWLLNFSIAQAPGDKLGLFVLLPAMFLVGIPVGIAYMFALTILIQWSCDILGGEPSRRKIRMLLAYAGVPGIIALVLFGLPKIAVFGHALFLPEREWLAANPLLVWGLWFGDAICFAWSLMLVVRGLKIMNGFSTGRAVFAAALPLAPIALIGFLFIVIVWTGVFFAPPAY
jgi:hypothetical protein